jgi:hypothetical protein
MLHPDRRIPSRSLVAIYPATRHLRSNSQWTNMPMSVSAARYVLRALPHDTSFCGCVRLQRATTEKQATTRRTGNVMATVPPDETGAPRKDSGGQIQLIRAQPFRRELQRRERLGSDFEQGHPLLRAAVGGESASSSHRSEERSVAPPCIGARVGARCGPLGAGIPTPSGSLRKSPHSRLLLLLLADEL